MENVEDLLAESDRVRGETLRMLAGWELIEALDEAVGLYKTFLRAYAPTMDREQETISCLRESGARDVDELDAWATDAAAAPADAEEVFSRYRATMDALSSKEVRGIMLAIAARELDDAIHRLVRRRLTATLGNQRVQVEAMALALIFLTRPSEATRWLHRVKTDQEGREFHRDHQEGILKILEEADLATIYGLGSGAALHARALGIAHALHSESGADRGLSWRRVTLKADEYDPQRPESFINFVIGLLKVQAKLFRLARRALPEAEDPILLEGRLPRFDARLEGLVARFRASFPEFATGAEERSRGGTPT